MPNTQDATVVAPTDYSLGNDQIAAFQRDGHILLRGLAKPEELATAREAILAAVKELNHETRSLAERDTYGKAFLQTMNLWRHNETVKQFVLAHRFAKVAAELMGVKGVRLYHDQALFKESGGGPTPWHQDQHYWPLDTDKTITMWMPLIDLTPEMGTMHFASESGANGYLGDLPISDNSEMVLEAFIKAHGYKVVPSGAMSAGDATFHSGWCLHGAPGNTQPKTREAMTVIYFADGVKVGPTDNPSRESDLKNWMPGLKSGDLAASELNPLLYSS